MPAAGFQREFLLFLPGATLTAGPKALITAGALSLKWIRGPRAETRRPRL